MLTYLIDAYNVIHRHPGLRGKLKKDFTGARETFLLKLAGFALRGNNEVVAVFDGTPAEAFPASGKLKIVYADPGKTADQKIKQLIDISRNPRNIVVVSSDGEVVRYGHLNSCRVLTAQEFVRLLEHEEKQGGDEKPVGETEREREEWLRLFSREK